MKNVLMATCLGLVLSGCGRNECAAPTSVRLIPFNAGQWRSADPEARIGMAKHLVERGALLGMSTNEVVAMLGTNVSPWDVTGMKWYLGKRRSNASLMFAYEEYLAVEFSPDGVVGSNKIVSLE